MKLLTITNAKGSNGAGRRKTVQAGILACLFLCLLPVGCKDAPAASETLPGIQTEQANVAAATEPEEPSFRIVAARTVNMAYETYNNGLFSMMIPKGWVVSTIGDYVHYTIRVTPPDSTDYQIFYNFKSEGYNKSIQAKQFWQTNNPENGFGDCPVLSEYTAQCFFTFFNDLGRINNSDTFTFPVVNDFTVIENFGPTVFGGDLLRASFDNESSTACDGVFTASVMDAGQYMINADPFDFSSPLIDVLPLSVYNTIILSAPAGELPDYEPILNNCFASLEFSEAFVQGFQTQEDSILSQIKSNSRVNAEISDSIMSSWTARNASHDVESQKYSDATLGYERVYDTETGEIYKAYNGFTDAYTGERYQPVTDGMYMETVTGYIEK